MQPISRAWCGLIDITYFCGRECVYCTRYDRHMGNRRYHMPVEDVKKALLSYASIPFDNSGNNNAFPGMIGIIGGEPLAHPDFITICNEIKQIFPKNKMVLFTSIDYKKSSELNELIDETFGIVAYHPHNPKQEKGHFHQPLTLAVKDMVLDEKLRTELIDDCWVQRKWCPTITADGAFFCEVGAALARLIGVKGWPVEPGWWRAEPAEFGYQKEICQLCGMCIPMERQLMSDRKQKISPSVLELLRRNNLPTGDYEMIVEPFTIEYMANWVKNWTPGLYKDEQMMEKFEWSRIDWDKWRTKK